MEKEMFCFKKSWRDALTGLPDQVRLEVYDTVIEYGLSGKLPNLKSRADVAFRFIKQDIDAMNSDAIEKQQRLSKMRSQAGRKSALSKKEKKEANKEANSTKTTSVDFVENKAKQPASAPSRAHVVADNNIFNNNINIKNNNQKIEREPVKRETEKAEVDLWDSSIAKTEKAKAAEYDAKAYVEFFNSEVAKANSVIPACRNCSKQRAENIRARARDHDEATMKLLVEKAVKSDFLNGKNKHCWIATFDWLIRPNNFEKVIDGNYDNNKISNNYGNSKQQYKIDPRRGTEAIECDPSEYF